MAASLSMPPRDKCPGEAMSDLIQRLNRHALPDPHDEREVLHAPLLREAAAEIERLQKLVDTLADSECDKIMAMADEQIMTGRRA